MMRVNYSIQNCKGEAVQIKKNHFFLNLILKPALDQLLLGLSDGKVGTHSDSPPKSTLTHLATHLPANILGVLVGERVFVIMLGGVGCGPGWLMNVRRKYPIQQTRKKKGEKNPLECAFWWEEE